MTTALVCLGLYAVIVAGYLVGNHRWCQMQKARAAAEHVNWLPFLPPVPRPTHRADDSLWLSIWPTDVDEDDLMNREFVSLISAEWDWTEPQP